jgi:hypothetical protein
VQVSPCAEGSRRRMGTRMKMERVYGAAGLAAAAGLSAAGGGAAGLASIAAEADASGAGAAVSSDLLQAAAAKNIDTRARSRTLRIVISLSLVYVLLAQKTGNGARIRSPSNNFKRICARAHNASFAEIDTQIARNILIE